MPDARADRIRRCADYVRERAGLAPRVGVVLGSGLGGYAGQLDIKAEISYGDIPGFPVSTVPGHEGKFIFGFLQETPVVLMKGRVHFYEGYPMEDVVLPIRVIRSLGASTLLLTNAAGGINTSFCPGNLMLITDQISTFVPNPLIGNNIEELGERFPDMSRIYSRRLCDLIRSCADGTGLTLVGRRGAAGDFRQKEEEQRGMILQEGVYAQLSGPSYETPAEIRMLRAMGADAVGMSTACEAIAARHAGMEVAGISCITNMAAGILDQPLNHEEVQETADKVKQSFGRLVTAFLKNL